MKNTKTINHDSVSGLQRFLWWSAGAVPAIMRKCGSDHVKATAMGALVLGVAVLAFVSFTFFLRMVFEIPLAAALLGGLMWSGLCLALERVLLTSFRKGETSNWTIALRIVLLIATAFVISQPIELAFFAKEINLVLATRNRETVTTARGEVTARYQGELDDLANSSKDIRTRLDQLKTDRDQKEAAVIEEVEGRSKTGKPGYGVAAKQKEQAFRDADAKYLEFKTEATQALNANRAKAEEIQARIDEETRNVETVSRGADGILARQAALFSVVTSSFGAAATYLATLLILVLIEVLPLTVKVSGGLGVYDKALAQAEDDAITELENESRQSREIQTAIDGRITDAVLRDRIDELNSDDEKQTANECRADAVRRRMKQLLDRRAEEMDEVSFGRAIDVEIVGRTDLKASLQLPETTGRRVSLRDLMRDVEAIAAGIGSGLGFESAFNSEGKRIWEDLPLLPQIGDGKLLLQFQGAQ